MMNMLINVGLGVAGSLIVMGLGAPAWIAAITGILVIQLEGLRDAIYFGLLYYRDHR